MDRLCAQCQRPIVGRNARAKFCSRACVDQFGNAKARAALLASRAPRTCVYCGAVIPVTRNALARFCNPTCAYLFRKPLTAEAKVRRSRARRADRGPCRRCGKPIPMERRVGAVYCSKTCYRKDADERWLVRAPVYMRERLYGITPEQYAALLESQGGRCAICRTDSPGGKGGWHFDHDHTTGAARGLLCHACNIALGYFADDPDRLRAAIAYLDSQRGAKV